MAIPNAVAVFCASSPGNQPAFTHAAECGLEMTSLAIMYGIQLFT